MIRLADEVEAGLLDVHGFADLPGVHAVHCPFCTPLLA
jgi:hypothetical protein